MNALLQAKLLKATGDHAPYANGHKLLSDNRNDYFAQSRMTTNGYRPTIAEARAMRAAEYAATAATSYYEVAND